MNSGSTRQSADIASITVIDSRFTRCVSCGFFRPRCPITQTLFSIPIRKSFSSMLKIWPGPLPRSRNTLCSFRNKFQNTCWFLAALRCWLKLVVNLLHSSEYWLSNCENQCLPTCRLDISLSISITKETSSEWPKSSSFSQNRMIDFSW